MITAMDALSKVCEIIGLLMLCVALVIAILVGAASWAIWHALVRYDRADKGRIHLL